MVTEAKTDPDYDRAVEVLKSKQGSMNPRLVLYLLSIMISGLQCRSAGWRDPRSLLTGCGLPQGHGVVGILAQIDGNLMELEIDKDYFRIVQANAGLQEFCVSYHGHDLFHNMERIV